MIDASTENTRHKADADADDGRHTHCKKRDQKRNAGPHQGASQQVTAKVICAKYMIGPVISHTERRQQTGVKLLKRWIDLPKRVADEGAQYNDPQGCYGEHALRPQGPDDG